MTRTATPGRNRPGLPLAAPTSHAPGSSLPTPEGGWKVRAGRNLSADRRTNHTPSNLACRSTSAPSRAAAVARAIRRASSNACSAAS
jgi:hypothetical protein